MFWNIMEDIKQMFEIILKKNEVIIEKNMYMALIAQKLDLYNGRNTTYNAVPKYYFSKDYINMQEKAEEVLKLTKTK